MSLFGRLFGKRGADRKNTQVPTTCETAQGGVLSPSDQWMANQALCDAAASGDVQKTASLLNKGANVDANATYHFEGGCTWSPLDHAAMGGHQTIAELLLANGANIAGGTPLHQAAARGDEDVVKLLCAKQANVNAADQMKRTPLFWAMLGRHWGIAEILIANGASVNGEPLKWAVMWGHKDAVEMLLAHGAKVNEVYNFGQTPLHLAVEKRHIDIVELLISRGADVNVVATSGGTPLYSAAYAGYKDIAELLIAHGADVNATNTTYSHLRQLDENDYTPLHTVSASPSGPPSEKQVVYKEIAAMLIAHGANVNAVSAEGQTPLHYAVQLCHADIAELLIAGGADVNARDKRGRQPADGAYGGEVRELLRRHGAKGIF